jgi:hypothetical protein
MARQGNIARAFSVKGTERIDSFLRTLCKWVPYFEAVERGISTTILSEAFRVAGWGDAEWLTFIPFVS